MSGMHVTLNGKRNSRNGGRSRTLLNALHGCLVNATQMVVYMFDEVVINRALLTVLCPLTRRLLTQSNASITLCYHIVNLNDMPLKIHHFLAAAIFVAPVEKVFFFYNINIYIHML